MTYNLAVLDELAEKWVRESVVFASLGSDISSAEAVVFISLAKDLRAAIALMRGQSWQPIETAPKDGTYVLVANSHGSWIAKWHPVYQSGYRPSNPWASMMLNHEHIEKPGRFDKPTHWQPLPAPPKDPADEQ